MRFLFIKARLAWPRTYGHDVHGFEMMRALSALGHDVALATEVPPSPKAIEGLTLSALWTIESSAEEQGNLDLTWLQERYRSYWGIEPGRIRTIAAISRQWNADVVVVVGLEILPYLAGVDGPVRIWYAADEWIWHYLSQLRSAPRETVVHLKTAAIKGLYERAYGPLMDRVWVVSNTERRAMRLVSGCRQVDVIPNGVDTETFQAVPAEVDPHSVVFWGRLGFGPNLQGLRWFVQQVWPIVRSREPQAVFSVLGSDPPNEVRALDGANGIRLVPNAPDLRPEISRHPVAVLPFVSGGGIKNKLLEAASMGRAIVGTTRAMSGLRSKVPAVVADDPRAFAESILRLWADAAEAETLGRAAREWAIRHHSWEAAAREAAESARRT